MWNVKRLLEISFLCLVIISSSLLGIGQDNYSLPLMAICFAILGNLVVDWTRLFSLPRWVANLLSVMVLAVTVQGFMDQESSGQLAAVANLLIYLQSLLMLQDKTPRQYWQLIVLNLLQMVVASVFILNLEGGFLFLLYVFIAAFFLSLLVSYDESYRLQLLNSRGSDTVSFFDIFGARKRPPRDVHILYEQPKPTRDFFWTGGSHLLVLIAVSSVFAGILFALIPRSQSPWFAGRQVAASRTGANKKMDVDERGVIQQSTDIVFRAKFREFGDDKSIQFPFNPYYRGMALGSLVIENNKTTWQAPYDRIRKNFYQQLPFQTLRNGTSNWLDVQITLEPTNDPLLYTVMPAFMIPGDVQFGEFCQDIAAITRENLVDRIEQTPHNYTFQTKRTSRKTLLQGWPYVPAHFLPSARTMAGNPAEYRWLTEMDPSRYPTTVALARQLAEQAGKDDHLAVARAMESHFWDSSRYTYTLDYRSIKRDDSLDPIEDFVRNFHTGHCEVYASALVIMLRSQGIPARVVVGYYGGEWLNDYYAISQANAHAWVEAYIRPEDCSEEMFVNDEADRGGCWLRLDPTPSTSLASINPNNSSLFRARTFWQDYVLGLNSSNQSEFLLNSSDGLAGMFDVSSWSGYMKSAADRLQGSSQLQVGAILIALLILGFTTVLSIYRATQKVRFRIPKGQKIGLLRRIFAQTAGMFFPKLGYWILNTGGSGHSIAFFQRYVLVGESHGIPKRPNETVRDFGTHLIERFRQTDSEPKMKSLVQTITDGFEQIRFGNARPESVNVSAMDSAVEQVAEMLEQNKQSS